MWAFQFTKYLMSGLEADASLTGFIDHISDCSKYLWEVAQKHWPNSPKWVQVKLHLHQKPLIQNSQMLNFASTLTLNIFVADKLAENKEDKVILFCFMPERAAAVGVMLGLISLLSYHYCCLSL